MQAQCSRSPTARADLVDAASSCAGALSLGGLSLPGLLATAAAAEPKRLLTGRSVIFLFLHGGPSQFETFDPKMSAPAEIRSTTGEIATRIPGVTFGSTFPKLAGLADRLAIVRSFTTGDANHDIKPVVSRHTGGANLGSLFARVAGTTDPVTGMPRNGTVVPACRRREHRARANTIRPFRFDGRARARDMRRSCLAPAAICSKTCSSICRSIGWTIAELAVAKLDRVRWLLRRDRPVGHARQAARAGIHQRH